MSSFKGFPRSGGVLAATVVAIVLWHSLPWLAMPTTARAQSPAPFFVTGRNTNTTGTIPPGPNPDYEGDPDHKPQNEAAFDVSPNNWLLVLGAFNDYRGVGLFGDSWIGYTVSTNGGLTWKSRLLPGHPTAPVGIGAADPVVRTMPGVGLISYITNRRPGRRDRR